MESTQPYLCKINPQGTFFFRKSQILSKNLVLFQIVDYYERRSSINTSEKEKVPRFLFSIQYRLYYFVLTVPYMTGAVFFVVGDL